MRLFNGHLKLDGAAVKKMFIMQLSNIYCIKSYLVENLPAMSVTASFSDLKIAIMESVAEIKLQVLRMDEIFRIIGEVYHPHKCFGIRALTIQAYITSKAPGMTGLETDFTLLVHLRELESIEVLCYTILLGLAGKLPEKGLSGLLKQNLDMAKDSKELYELITREYLN